MKKVQKKRSKDIAVFSPRQVDAMVKLARSDAYAKGKASCANDHLTVTATLGGLEPNRTYCLVRTAPLEIEQPRATLGF